MSFPCFNVNLTQAEVRSTSTVKKHALGTRGVLPDGRVYRYALAGEALSIGIPLNPVARGGLATAGLTAIINDTEDISTTSAQVVLSSTNSTWGALLNEYADGYFVVEASTATNGSGQMVRVKSNTAGSTSTTDSPYSTTIVFDEESRLTAALSTGDTIQVVHNEFFDVIEHDGGATSLPIIGVPNIVVADNAYFWAQTWGVCPVLNDGALVYGEIVVGSTQSDQGVQAITTVTTTTDTGVSGLVPLVAAVERPKVGWVFGPNAGDGEYTLIFLQISP